MNKLDSMWYHEGAPGSNKLASSHIAVLFCALVLAGMVVDELLEMEFEGISKTFDDESLSPMDYFIAYTDGELYDEYIKPKFRTAIAALFDSDGLVKLLEDAVVDGLEHNTKSEVYTLKCNWHNVHVVAKWLRKYSA